MSQWTHVCGCIRYDWIRPILGPMPLEEILGTPADFEDEHDSKNIPTGSEGSIQWHLIEDPMEENLASYTVAIWGDLRDFGAESLDQIRSWFRKITTATIDVQGNSVPVMVRDAVLSIEVEFGQRIILKHDKDKEILETLLPIRKE